MVPSGFQTVGRRSTAGLMRTTRGTNAVVLAFISLKKKFGSIVCLFLLFKERKKFYVLGYEPFRQQRKHVSGNKIQRLFSTS